MSVDPYNQNSLEMAVKILERFGLVPDVGPGLQPSSINNGGFPVNHTPYDYFRLLVNKTGVK